jgi:hypothetical protein
MRLSLFLKLLSRRRNLSLLCGRLEMDEDVNVLALRTIRDPSRPGIGDGCGGRDGCGGGGARQRSSAEAGHAEIGVSAGPAATVTAPGGRAARRRDRRRCAVPSLRRSARGRGRIFIPQSGPARRLS